MEIIPISDLRNTNKISEMCSTSDDPIFITKNGYGHAVMMSKEKFDREQREKKELRLVNIVLESELEQLQNGGKTKSLKSVVDELNAKYNL